MKNDSKSALGDRVFANFAMLSSEQILIALGLWMPITLAEHLRTWGDAPEMERSVVSFVTVRKEAAVEQALSILYTPTPTSFQMEDVEMIIKTTTTMTDVAALPAVIPGRWTSEMHVSMPEDGATRDGCILSGKVYSAP
jgi:hypothetical protein